MIGNFPEEISNSVQQGAYMEGGETKIGALIDVLCNGLVTSRMQ